MRRHRHYALILAVFLGGILWGIQQSVDYFEATILLEIEADTLKTVGPPVKALSKEDPWASQSLFDTDATGLMAHLGLSNVPSSDQPHEKSALLILIAPVIKGALQSVAFLSVVGSSLFFIGLLCLYRQGHEQGRTIPISAEMKSPAGVAEVSPTPDGYPVAPTYNPNLPHERVHQLTHEIKNPLTGIRLAAKALMEQDTQAGSTFYPVQIVTQVDRIQRVVDRMLLLASLERQERLRVRQRLSVAGVFDGCLVDLKPLLEAHALKVQLDVDATLTIHADFFLMAMLFENVMANAIGFSPPGSSLDVVIEQRDSEVMIVIRDQGPGIPEHLMTKVHEVFFSIPKPGGDHPGTGLGLSIVSEIVSLHGGSWTLTNHPRCGAMATILLPLALAEA